MQIKKVLVSLVLLLVTPFALKAQDGSISVFSPYTIYGVGNINSTAPTVLRAMGGAGVAYANAVKINTLNPASNSYAAPNTFLLSFGGEGGGYYLKSSSTSTSENVFNFSDISIRFPVFKGFGMSASITPYSSVGYAIGDVDSQSYQPEVEYNAVLNSYTGSGGVSQVKLGIGGRVFDKLSLGIDVIYYFGSITRYFNTTIVTNNTGFKDYPTTVAYTKENISKFSFNLGAQYDINFTQDNILTLGATYLYGGKLGSEIHRVVSTGNEYDDLTEDSYTDSGFNLSSNFTFGLSYRTRKYQLLADYTFAQWEDRNDAYEAEYSNLKFQNTHTIKLGGEYTPDRFNVRSFGKRISYRAGFSYGGSYVSYYDTSYSDKMITLGVGVPIKQAGISAVNLALELGETGVISGKLFRQRYFKLSVGLNLFGEDYWFVKQKYN